ncbi:hypothetical protein P4O66_001141 [Electrophorus voltai]|uniref:CEP170 C-terminal domain-containing protein n=1 Tax=Electrophorus voltai TaxID=2609070 RepID=A0AAD9DUB5_9TELE|nr:hypothetical protein P4O66_001141 [Electrophorus voltai]
MSNKEPVTGTSRLASSLPLTSQYATILNFSMSRSVDKQHAVINFSPATDEHLVKDLGSLNGHEKYTIQLHMGLKASEEKRQDLQEERSKLERFERKGLTEAPVPRPTPLYGQPSWWGEEDLGNKGPDNESCKIDNRYTETHKEDLDAEAEVSGSLQDFHDSQSKSAFVYHREPSYFEIPTKEFPTHPVTPAVELNDFPTKDTNALLTPTPPVVQSHASFTIEFDECTPGKIKIKDHVTKFSSHQRSKQQQNRKPLATAPVDVLSAESKVADWLVQSDVSMIHRRPPCDDVYSTKSDLAMHIRTLKGHHHEDGTQSDSEDPSIHSNGSFQPQPLLPFKQVQDFYVHPEKNYATHVEETTSLTESLVKSGHRETLSQQAFIIEFLDDNPRKKRSQSFTHNPAHAETYSALKAKLDRRKGGAYGERPASVHGHIPATQQITVPLKGSSHSGLQRSSSLKREKTEEPINWSSISPSSSGPSSRCSPAITSKPFGSVGKKSKMAQDFSAELHKDSEQISPSPKSAPPVMVSPAHNLLTPSPPNTCGPSSVSYTSSPSQLPALSQAIFSSSSPVTVPSHQPTLSLVSSTSPVSSSFPQLSSVAVSGVDSKSSRMVHTEEEDSLSDAGTYTIETESQDKEVEEARNMIDQVFGVLDAPEYSGQTFGVYRPVINEQAIFNHVQSGSVDMPTAGLSGNLSGDPASLVQGHTDLEGQPKWVSRWASLADTYSEAGTTQAPSGTSTQGELAIRDGRVALMVSQSLENSESECSQSSRTRRLLPQVPPAGEKQEISTPNILIQHNPNLDNEPTERSSRTPQQQDSTHRLRVQDDVDPDSLSDTSRSDDGSILDRNTRTQGHHRPTTPSPTENVPHKTDRDPSLKLPPTTVLIRHLSSHEPRRPVKPNSSAPNLQNQERDAVFSKEHYSSSFVRQESFTKDRPSDNIQVKRLPHISSHPALRDLGTGGSDSALSDDMRNLVSQESKQAVSAQPCKNGGSLGQADDSLSGESDVDTASSVSVVSSKNAPVSASIKRTSSNGLCKDKCASSLSAQPTARDRLSEKRRNHATADNTAKAEVAHHFQLHHSAGNRASLDLSENQNSHGQQLWPDTAASDHESCSRPANHKKLTGTLQKEDIRKSNKAGLQVLTRSNSLSAPRPTRASMLRRARLGDTSDNEGAETDRGSQSSEHTKIPGDGKKLSRLDILAMPRKRTGSFTAPSDNESISVKPGTPSRAAESSISGRKLSSGEPKQTTIKGTSAVEKHSSMRTRTSQAKQNSTNILLEHQHYLCPPLFPGGSRRRQKGFDYSSTSEEEFETSSNSKNKHAHASASTQTQTQTPKKKIQARLKPGSLETEEEEAQNKHYQNWSTHSAEIARLSQDLAKDLAILAREIHDVAGDGDAQTSSVMGTNTSPGSMPNTPASTISAREEVLLDNLMLNPVSQLSQAIRENTEQLAEKMKALFHNKTAVWEETEAKINAENEVPIIKTSNKEISSILQELRRVQRQLEVINTIVEPVGASKLTSVPPVGKTKPSSTARNANTSAKRGSERDRHVV